MRLSARNTLILAGALVVVVASSACNQTVKRMSIPASSAWNTFVMPIASPYDDLQIVTTGSDIQAEIQQQSPALNYCSNGSDATILQIDSCPAGYSLLGVRYFYLFAVQVNRPAFQYGGVDLVSDAKGVVYSLSLAVNSSTHNVFIAAGASDGVIPLSSQNPPTPGEVIAVDDYATVGMLPHDPGFANASYGPDPDFPDFICDTNATDTDLIVMKTTTPGTASYACGSLTFNLSLSSRHDNLGQCISSSIQTNCKDQGLTGKARATCNKQQQSVCRALFNK